jgi:hypothetical protein
MEAGQPRQPAAPPAAAPSDTEKAGTGWRVIAGILAVLLAFAAAVMIAVAVDLADGPRCEQATFGECYDVSKTEQTVGTILLFASGIASALAFLAGAYFVFRGRGGRTMAIAAGAAIVLGAIALVIA